jgi:hypothetical protein
LHLSQGDWTDLFNPRDPGTAAGSDEVGQQRLFAEMNMQDRRGPGPPWVYRRLDETQ